MPVFSTVVDAACPHCGQKTKHSVGFEVTERGYIYPHPRAVVVCCYDDEEGAGCEEDFVIYPAFNVSHKTKTVGST